MTTRLVVSILFLCLIIGCTAQKDDNKNTSLVEGKINNYLQNKGYKVLAADGKVEEYEISKQKLTQMPYMIYWGLQERDPIVYIDKKVEIYKYVVNNHPLDTYNPPGTKSQRKTELFIYVIDGEIVGGTSYPKIEPEQDGGYWSLEGKTIEEVQKKDYETWRQEWLNKYK
ncbi:hypothetical protein P4H65_12065 [Paenibacillus chitinolyticus]|uniref:hypothetical protein n=1 Tax=Paenibacillus chitinolyticus TaxID=79263 RepID=UPI002DB805B1|nr:hypothetical protein [Paenibacillus chitinolyticus]MEC0246523.1 hypothetical protein [Paenibacillus chitinolyticus]